MPESARYCLLIGKVEKAERILARVAWINGKSLPSVSMLHEDIEMCIINRVLHKG